MTEFRSTATVFASLALVSQAAFGIEPCGTPLRNECLQVQTSVVVDAAHSDFRSGYASGTFLEGGAFGEGELREDIQGPRRFKLEYIGNASASIATDATASTDDGSLFANAMSDADLAAGTMRASIDGFDSPLFPASLGEASRARVDMRLRDTLIFHLPANYAGGDIVTFSMAVDGTLGGARFEGPGFDNSEIFFSLFAPSNPLEFRRWTTPGTHSEVIQQQVELPAFSAPSGFPVTFSAFVRLDSSQASGGFLVDMANTAALSVDIPDHLSWESESGIFLSNVSAVPEPPVAICDPGSRDGSELPALSGTTALVGGIVDKDTVWDAETVMVQDDVPKT